ncbi:50S ribosomal protein L7ae [Marinitoga sp. 1135]|uniref:Ribosomal protein HS6-type (S12/L30/L7a) n=1 Tax=Marinitoga piezophila (strain DSM 14283 / JCM 11233 / KA3) TaxID=443254 RepID=H2J3C8_MARPK|nr:MULTISPECIES: ribosomal L7Ae/L30e/S12e/Gadd45 family protein [Marinitoga]AEX85744.1 ribosomal protein HS6-type (S12/L30/L7a) [Marinitoga piezophila KA3]APT76189.1 50S ribosomal protein L7ae [Marinitoga sp. 1137]NUU95948.1 50S ribosomal protein L7ae [Marinitoga sp. 1135]NUU97859.1 50S ribosomal protein L7ae [Marinitoga sp. 1138]
MNEQKIVNLLGFAARMRKIIFGKDNIREYIRNPRKRYKFIVIASDTGESIKEDTIKRCQSHRVPYVLLKDFTKETLGKSLGRDEISVVGVLDENIVKGLIDVANVGGDSNV